MARACSICRRQDRSEIDRALLSGTPQLDIAAKHRVAQSSLSRHLHNHLAPRALAAIGRYDPVDEEKLRSYAAGVLDELAFGVVRAKQGMTAARTTGDVDLERAHGSDHRAYLRDLTRALELQGKLAHVLGDRPVVNVDARKQVAVLAAMSEGELRALVSAGSDEPAPDALVAPLPNRVVDSSSRAIGPGSGQPAQEGTHP